MAKFLLLLLLCIGYAAALFTSHIKGEIKKEVRVDQNSGVPGRCRRVATFNAAIVKSVPDYESRTPERLGEKLKQNDADTYCLQEIWQESQVKRLLSSLGDDYPYHYSKIHYNVSQLRKSVRWSDMDMLGKVQYAASSLLSMPEGPCSLTDLGYFGVQVVPCAQANGCFDLMSFNMGQGAECVFQKCAEKLKSEQLSPACISCIVLMAGDSGLTVKECSPSLMEKQNRWNGPGLLLVSKRPLTNVKYSSLWPNNDMVVERGTIEADLTDDPRDGKLVCTHLTADGQYFVEYDSSYTSYRAIHTQEIDTLVRRYTTLDGQAHVASKHVLMGDFNMGPRGTDLAGELDEDYSRLRQRGQYNDYYYEHDGRCTYCTDNPLVDSPNNVLDNVLTHGDYGVRSYRRILDDTDDGHSLSDHYGVEATLCPPL